MVFQQSQNIWHNLWKCLIDTRAVSATDGRDRIFALKAFLGKDRKEISELINYSMDTKSLFAKVAELLLGSMKLLLLTAARHPHNFPQNDPHNPESSPASHLQTMAAESRTESSPSPLRGPLELDGAESRSVVSSTFGVDVSDHNYKHMASWVPDWSQGLPLDDFLDLLDVRSQYIGPGNCYGAVVPLEFEDEFEDLGKW
jgi:hypothetical protein